MYCTLQGWSISETGSQQQQWQDHEQPPILELSPEPTRRILELSENYTHKIQCVAGGFGCELLQSRVRRTLHWDVSREPRCWCAQLGKSCARYNC